MTESKSGAEDGAKGGTKIKIENLYKIFGAQPRAALARVKRGVSKRDLIEQHGHVLGLKDINVEVAAHSVTVVMGLSGSGKSTLIRHINRLIEPTAGRIMVDDRDVLAMAREELIEFRRHQASMVFQRFGLHVHKTAAENVAYGLVIQGMPVDQAKAQSHHWVERVGLSGFEDHYPSQLSGGINRARVIEVKSVMTPGRPAGGAAVTVRDNLVLEEALQRVAGAGAADVVDADGAVLGSIHLEQIIAGIARPGVKGGGEIRYK